MSLFIFVFNHYFCEDYQYINTFLQYQAKYGNRKDKQIKNSISGTRQDWKVAVRTVGKK